MKLNGGTAAATQLRKADFGFAQTSWFEASVTTLESPRVITGSESSSITVKDANLVRYGSGSFAIDSVLNLDVLSRTRDGTPTKTLNGNSVVQFGNSAQVLLESIGNGFGSLSLVSDSRTVTLSVAGQIIMTQTDALSSWVGGSLCAHSDSQIVSLLASVTPPSGLAAHTFSQAASLFSTKETGAGNGVAVRNSGNWLSTLDLSGISTWSTQYGSAWHATAISRRHLVNARHVGFSPGTKIWFCSQDGTNTRTFRTVSKYKSFTEGTRLYDLGLVTLDSELPEWVVPFKVMPANWFTAKAPSLIYGAGLVFVTQEHLATLVVSTDSNDVFLSWRPVISSDPNYIAFHPYALFPRYGDSGMPTFLVVNGNLVLLSVAGGPSVGSTFDRLHSQINAEMAVAGSYSLAEADLSSFASY